MKEVPKSAPRAYLDLFAQEIRDAFAENRSLNEAMLEAEFRRLSPEDQQVVRDVYRKDTGREFKF